MASSSSSATLPANSRQASLNLNGFLFTDEDEDSIDNVPDPLFQEEVAKTASRAFCPSKKTLIVSAIIITLLALSLVFGATGGASIAGGTTLATGKLAFLTKITSFLNPDHFSWLTAAFIGFAAGCGISGTALIPIFGLERLCKRSIADNAGKTPNNYLSLSLSDVGSCKTDEQGSSGGIPEGSSNGEDEEQSLTVDSTQAQSLTEKLDALNDDEEVVTEAAKE